MWRDHAASAKDRFHDECGNGIGTLKSDLVRKGGSAQLCQPRRVGFIERVAIGIGCRNVIAAGKKRFVLGAKIGISVDTGTTDMGAVIPLFQADNLTRPESPRIL